MLWFTYFRGTVHYSKFDINKIIVYIWRTISITHRRGFGCRSWKGSEILVVWISLASIFSMEAKCILTEIFDFSLLLSLYLKLMYNLVALLLIFSFFIAFYKPSFSQELYWWLLWDWLSFFWFIILILGIISWFDRFNAFSWWDCIDWFEKVD